jgi:hypothetical protein
MKIFDAIFPPGVPRCFGAVYQDIGRIVKQEVTAANWRKLVAQPLRPRGDWAETPLQIAVLGVRRAAARHLGPSVTTEPRDRERATGRIDPGVSCPGLTRPSSGLP